MDYAQQQRNPGKHTVGIAIVILTMILDRTTEGAIGKERKAAA